MVYTGRQVNEGDVSMCVCIYNCIYMGNGEVYVCAILCVCVCGEREDTARIQTVQCLGTEEVTCVITSILFGTGQCYQKKKLILTTMHI